MRRELRDLQVLLMTSESRVFREQHRMILTSLACGRSGVFGPCSVTGTGMRREPRTVEAQAFNFALFEVQLHVLSIDVWHVHAIPRAQVMGVPPCRMGKIGIHRAFAWLMPYTAFPRIHATLLAVFERSLPGFSSSWW